MIPGVCENPVILNLHFLFGNLKLSAGCQATEFAVEGRRPIAESPLALLGVKIAGTALWDHKRERPTLQKIKIIKCKRESPDMMWMRHIRFFFCPENHKVLHQMWDDVSHKQDYFQNDSMKDHSHFHLSLSWDSHFCKWWVVTSISQWEFNLRLG